MMRAHHIFMVRDIFIRQDPHSPYAVRVRNTFRTGTCVIVLNIFLFIFFYHVVLCRDKVI